MFESFLLNGKRHEMETSASVFYHLILKRIKCTLFTILVSEVETLSFFTLQDEKDLV